MSRNNSDAQSIILDEDVSRRRLIDVSEFAQLIGVEPRTIFRMRSAKKVPKPLKVSGSTRWRLGDVLEWIDCGCPPMDDDQQ